MPGLFGPGAVAGRVLLRRLRASFGLEPQEALDRGVPLLRQAALDPGWLYFQRCDENVSIKDVER